MPRRLPLAWLVAAALAGGCATSVGLEGTSDEVFAATRRALEEAKARQDRALGLDPARVTPVRAQPAAGRLAATSETDVELVSFTATIRPTDAIEPVPHEVEIVIHQRDAPDQTDARLDRRRRDLEQRLLARVAELLGQPLADP